MQELKAMSGEWVANGTRYALVFTQDPFGGVLVAWPDGGVLGRAVKNGSGRVGLKVLVGRLRKLDGQELARIVTHTPGLPWGGEA
ncbi:hypothetical protein L6R49_29285 [Myxococcota bacterium]|nr:hypothetical protein [Myxococcota bacterium]